MFKSHIVADALRLKMEHSDWLLIIDQSQLFTS